MSTSRVLSLSRQNHRFVEILSLFLLLAPLSDLVVADPHQNFPVVEIVSLGAAFLVAGGMVFRSLRALSLVAVAAGGLVQVFSHPEALQGPLLILLSAFFIHESGWVASLRKAALLGLCILLVAAQLSSAVLMKTLTTANLILGAIADGLLVTVLLIFRSDPIRKGLDAATKRRFSQRGLNPREQKIVHLVWGGLTTKAIAHTLGLTPGRVRNQLTQIYRKLGIVDGKELLLLSRHHTQDHILSRESETKTPG